MNIQNSRIAVIGLGYVGLPLAVEFGKKYPTVGFDINKSRVEELKGGEDHTLEVSSSELGEADSLEFSCDINELRDSNVYVVTVPTPIDEHHQPDLTPLKKASEVLGKVVAKGDVIIYESTVYPGATEEDCIPVVESVSGLKFNEDFFAGYSPERINPGDKEHRVTNIMKVTSGSTPEVADFVDSLYSSVITAGTHKAESIKVAEAAKVIENTQRDLNIALINELSVIFDRLGIDTESVLKAAGTKWNFLPFRPGLVGGHCIGVDPYYLTHKSKSVGYQPDVILAGRKINDGMSNFVVTRFIQEMIRKRIHINGGRILVLGLSFKENCPDIRNTKVVGVIEGLKEYGANVDVYDPWVCQEEAKYEYGITLIEKPAEGAYDGVILAVAHDEFTAMADSDLKACMKGESVVYDLKHVLPSTLADIRL